MAEFIEAGQGLFKQDWFSYFDLMDDGFYIGGGGQFNPTMLTHFGAIDVAVTTEERSDYTVITSFALTPDGKLFVEDVLEKK